MCFTRVRVTATTLVAGGVLVTGMSAVALTTAVAPSAFMDAVHAAGASGQQCAAVYPPQPTPTPTPSTSPTPSPSTSPTPASTSSAASKTTAGLDAYRGGIGAVTELCVSVVRSQASVTRGHPASFVVSVWTLYGPATDVTLGLSAAPSSQHAVFTLGCGSGDGSSTCHIGSVDNTSAARQLQAQITVSSSDTSVTAASLTAVGTATYAKSYPTASSSVAVTTPASHPSPHPSNSGSNGGGGTPSSQSTSLPVGNILPSLNGNGSSVSNGGSVGGMFPTINPSATPGRNGSSARHNLAGEPAADVVSLGTPVVGAQIVGLIALALAFVLAVTRLSLRRRPATAKAAAASDTSASTNPPKD